MASCLVYIAETVVRRANVDREGFGWRSSFSYDLSVWLDREHLYYVKANHLTRTCMPSQVRMASVRQHTLSLDTRRCEIDWTDNCTGSNRHAAVRSLLWCLEMPRNSTSRH